MVFSVRSAGGIGLSFVFAASLALAQSKVPSAQPTLLPDSFAGWSAAAPAQTGTDPSAIDSSDASVLKEYGLQSFALREYRHTGIGNLKIEAMRFGDATGAYGTFTFFRKPEMHPDAIGKEAAVSTHEALFWSGATFIDATADHFGPEERAALKALAEALPQNAGPEGVPPTLPRYLPTESLDRSTVRYAIGPEAYVKGGGVLPPDLIDFSREAETVTAQYQSREGTGTLTVLEYPTPQMAADRTKAIDAMLKGALPASIHGTPAALGVQQHGPFISVTSGNFSASQAEQLRGGIKYRPEVTWNHPEGYTNEVRKTARLLLGIVYLTCIVGGASILVGISLGGGRALFRVLRGKPASVMNDDDFISLKLGN